MRPYIYIQCLGQDKETMKFVWQVIYPSKDTNKIVLTNHGGREELMSVVNQGDMYAVVELPNPFVHFSGDLKQI